MYRAGHLWEYVAIGARILAQSYDIGLSTNPMPTIYRNLYENTTPERQAMSKRSKALIIYYVRQEMHPKQPHTSMIYKIEWYNGYKVIIGHIFIYFATKRHRNIFILT